MKSQRVWMGGVAAAMAVMLAAAGASAKTWTGGDGNWFVDANWDPIGVPGNGATVFINTGATVLLTNETAELASLTMTGGTLTFSNWTTRLRATTVTLTDGELTLPAAFEEGAMSNRLWVVCHDFTLEADAALNADGKGYLGSQGEGGASANLRQGGGGHGGRGGRGDLGPGGWMNGMIDAPRSPGSGGSGGLVNGGAGGGVIHVQASGTVILNGTITAGGAANNHGHAGGGAGGSIHIESDVIAGSATAVVSATGGNGGSHGGGGGGGRIAVAYTTLSNAPAVRFSTAPGAGWGDNITRLTQQGWFYGSGWGSLSLPDGAWIGTQPNIGQFDRVNVYFRDTDVWSLAHLTVVSNRLVFATPGLRMNVDADLTVDTDGEWGIGEIFGDGNSELTVGNRLVVTNGGILSVYSGLAVESLNDFGARVEASNALVVADGSWVHPYSHTTNGGSVRFVTEQLTVAAGGGVNAFARGYAGLQGPGKGSGASARGSGGGHGGRGGASDLNAAAGITNGVLNRPMRPGSGGGGLASIFGGGLIYLEATTLNLSGTLNADGAIGGGAGSGAGGGIVLDGVTLAGQSPLLHADGGSAAGNGGGGGGGRIAVHAADMTGLVAPRFRTRRGAGGSHAGEYRNWQLAAEQGTVWFSDPSLLSETIDDWRFDDVIFYADGFSTWTVPSLTISNSFLTFGGEGFVLTVEGDLTLGPNGALGMGRLLMDNGPALTCGGNLIMKDGAALHVHGGHTNGGIAEAGAVVDIAGDWLLEQGAWVFPYAHVYNGGAPRLRARSLTVEKDAGFKAIGRGYQYTLGPGAGTTGGSGRGGGGGHGGAGGDGSAGISPGGGVYGLAAAPYHAGSGGGSSGSGAFVPGGNGGGVVWLEIAQSVHADGSFIADGINGGGGGAGGAILIAAADVIATTNVMLSASGGNGGSALHTGGGGGGRIVVWRQIPEHERILLFSGQEVARLTERITDGTEPFSRFEGKTFALGGTLGLNPGGDGTVRFIDGTPRGTMISVR